MRCLKNGFPDRILIVRNFISFHFATEQKKKFSVVLFFFLFYIFKCCYSGFDQREINGEVQTTHSQREIKSNTSKIILMAK